MNAIIQMATQDDDPFLWEMLYYATQMEEDGEVSPQAAKRKGASLSMTGVIDACSDCYAGTLLKTGFTERSRKM